MHRCVRDRAGWLCDTLPGRSQQHSQIVVGIGVAWIDFDRTPIRVDCGVQPLIRLKHDAEVAVPVRLIRHERDTSLNERESFLVSSLLVRKQAGVVQRPRMIGRHFEHAAIDLAGCNELLTLLQNDRD